MGKCSQPFVPVIKAIVVPQSVLDGLLTALHIKLNHTSRHQFQMVLQRQFFALDINDAISHKTSACHHHHHHQSLFIHEIISFYMVFLGIVFKTRLKYSKELLTPVPLFCRSPLFDLPIFWWSPWRIWSCRSLLCHWCHQASSSIDPRSPRMHHILHCFLFDTRWETWHSPRSSHMSNLWSTPSWQC